jgi:hypothetical protein
MCRASSPRQERRYSCLFLAPAPDTVRSVNGIAQFPLARIIAVTSSVSHGHRGMAALRKDIPMAKPDFPARAGRSAHPLAKQESGEGTRFATILVALVASLCALALVPVAQASASSGRSGLTAHRTGRITQGTLAPGGPRTWHVLVGAQSKNKAIQAEGYYPHVITIDAGDTVVWTLIRQL